MINWHEFYESKLEKAEERSGIDFDQDKEKGESAEHKKKFEKKHKEMLNFFDARKSGAAKIASQAKEGPSILTHWHFAAKAKPYQEVLNAIKEGKNKDFFVSKFKSLIAKLSAENQKNFQEAIGRVEVWGEAIAELFGK